MIPRTISPQILARLQSNPAVVLLGPRQVGKTTLARQIARQWPGESIYLDMERPADRRRLEDADQYLRGLPDHLIVIDEIQKTPGLFETLRGVIDEWRFAGKPNGHFSLLGSAGIELLQQASESLAGRLATLSVEPIQCSEASAAAISNDKLWLRGGFPLSLLSNDDQSSLDWRRDFIRSYLERDVPLFAPRLPAQTIGGFWAMLASAQGAITNQSQLAASLGLSSPAVGRYVDLLVDLCLVRRLAPYHANITKRLVKAPKLYVRDSGLLHALLEIESVDQLLSHLVCGASYEGFVIENLIAAAGPRYRPYFFRTHVGAEIDLLLVKGDTPEIAIEVKRSSAPSPSRGFGSACDTLGVEKRFVVYPGEERFPVRHGALAVGLGEMLIMLRNREPEGRGDP